MAEIVRPPIVTILGHVDHGKTTLLDFIRKSSVASKEHGGITQAIGAYQVQAEGKTITFIDTPGHAAFEKMRSRGAQVADISVLVVAVDDGVMPQTVEAIKHIKIAGTAMIVAVNKIDKPGINLTAQIEKIKRQLSDQEVLVEEYGGDVPIVQVSAQTGQGVNDLLETINLVAEMNELTGDSSKPTTGVVIESRLDKSRGPVATILVRDGSLKKGEAISLGTSSGKIRGMFDYAGNSVDIAGPSTPVEVLGLEVVPAVGAKLGEETIVKNKLNMSSLVDKLRENDEQVINVILKADNQGSLEAVQDIVNKFNEETQHVKTVLSGMGDVLNSDVELASSTKAIILGFNVNVATSAQRIAEAEHVLIRTYNVIYELQEEVQDVVDGILQPGALEEVFGRAQIIAQFPFGKNERIAGCKVLEGIFSKNLKVRIIRGEEIIGESKIKSLKKVREEVAKMEKGQECGMLFESLIDFQVGDIVESYRNL